MLKSLIAVGLASILITQPPQNTNDGTYYQDVEITESYEYETNEVNSVDDLVVGNIYKFSNTFPFNDLTRLNGTAIYNFTLDSNQETEPLYTNIDLSIKNLENNYFTITLNGNNINVQKINNNVATTMIFVNQNIYTNINFYIVYKYVSGETNFYQYLSASDYLGEKTITVEPIETEGLYNLAYHFLYSRIYTNTELQAMETTLFGTTINMNMWLSHTTAIVIICLLLIVLIKFVLWLFKIVSGGMLWK